MKYLFFRWMIFLFPLLLLGGCSILATPSATLPDQPLLTAMASPFKIIKPDQSETTLNKGVTTPIALNEVLSAEDNGRGLLFFGDKIIIDIYRGSKSTILEFTNQPQDAPFVKMQQISGHVRVRVSETSNAQVRLITTIATITTLRPGSDFVLCHDPTALTCIVALKGEIEVVGQGKVVRIKGGEGTYILKDKPPFDPICADLAGVNAWIDNKLGTAPIEALGQLVAGWKPQPCSASSAVPTATLPSSDGMVQIPAGNYTVGVAAPNDYQIAHLQGYLPAYWIDQFDVTNAQYQQYIQDTHHAPPSVWPGKDTLPVSGVTWDDASAYCAWVHKNLPTEAQWEVAARGPGSDPPSYPWGNDPQAGGKIGQLPLDQPYPVGSIQFNKSPFGIYDMAGNVWQWVSQPYKPISGGSRILHGGRYGLIKDMAYRQPAEPNSPSFLPFTGFRCAADQVQGK